MKNIPYLYFLLFSLISLAQTNLTIAPKGRATISVPSLALVQISNTPAKAEIAINPISLPAPEENPEDLHIGFTLRNETAQSIPLIIPGVMNPNLSPFSNSGVRLKIGQQINFRQGLKTYTLLTVSHAIEEGAVLEIGARLQEKKIELGLK